MQVKTKAGKCTVTLDARERRNLRNAIDTLGDIVKFAPSEYVGSAQDALSHLEIVWEDLYPSEQTPDE